MKESEPAIRNPFAVRGRKALRRRKNPFAVAKIPSPWALRRRCRRPCWPRAVPSASAAHPHVSWPRAARQPRLIVPPPKVVSLLTSPQGACPADHPACKCVRRSSWLLGAACAGLQLLLGPRTSGVDVTFLFLVCDDGASRPLSKQGAPNDPPHPHPCVRPSHPARPMHGSRTFPRPCTAHAPPCTPRFHLTPLCPSVRRSSMLLYLPRPGSRATRRGGAAAAGWLA